MMAVLQFIWLSPLMNVWDDLVTAMFTVTQWCPVLLFCQTYSGLRAQDLQEAKDQLLVETSDMLRVPLFTAEALLRNHGMFHSLLH